MTVSQLKDIAERRGVKLPKGAKKSIIIGLLEVSDEADGVIEAEVIEPEANELSVTFKAGVITANFDALEKVVDGILAQYDGWEPSADDAEDVAQCARERKYLNGLAKQIDERRKEKKGEFLLPLNAFESECNRIRDKIKRVSARISAVEQEAEERRKSEKKAELRDHYEAYAGLLLDVVPYERLHDERWLNKTVPLDKAIAELESKIDGIAKDWDTLKSLGLECYKEAEAQFFNTLDVGGAIAWAGKLAEDKRKIEAMKSFIEASNPTIEASSHDHIQELADEYEPAPVTCEADEYMPPHPVYRAPEPIIEPDGLEQVLHEVSEMLRAYPRDKVINLRNALRTVSQPDPEEPRERVMVIDAATVTQLRAIGKFCGLLGVTGTFKRGSLSEVVDEETKRYAREAMRGVYGYGG